MTQIITTWRAEIEVELAEARGAVASQIAAVEAAEALLASITPKYRAAEVAMTYIGRHEVPAWPLLDRFTTLKQQHEQAASQLRMHRGTLDIFRRRIPEWSNALEQLDAVERHSNETLASEVDTDGEGTAQSEYLNTPPAARVEEFAA